MCSSDLITLDPSSNTSRHGFEGDTTGTTDSTSSNTAPTFNVVLPVGARVGDKLKLFLNGDVTQPWAESTLTDADLVAGKASVTLSALPTQNGDGITPLDGAYTFKARLIDVAGNASDWSSAFTYTQDTQASAPTINGLTLDRKSTRLNSSH